MLLNLMALAEASRYDWEITECVHSIRTSGTTPKNFQSRDWTSKVSESTTMSFRRWLMALATLARS